MLDFLGSAGSLGAAALGVAGYFTVRRYIDGCRVQVVTGDAKTSAVVRQTGQEGVVTLRDVLYSSCPSLTDPESAYMVPTPYLATGLLQTIFSTLWVRKKDAGSDIDYERELLIMDDAATISLDWYPGSKEGAHDGPIALVMSGVGGSSHEHHIRATAKALAQSAGSFHVVVVNHRGTAKTPITSARPYDSGFTDDFRAAVKHVREQHPQSKLAGIGFSMGANILTKYIGEEGSDCLLSCAVTVCNPFDIAVSGAAMNASNLLNDHVFQPAVMGTLMRALKRAQHLETDPSWNLDVERIRNAKKLYELEEEILVKINGYESLADYYRRSSCVHFVDRIAIPYLAINSLDDRITPPRGIPVDKFKSNPNIALALVPHGGHLGFFAGLPPRIWFIEPIEQFISAIIS
ncbi:hypothetical protein GGI07_002244 [Coemansia sp. Benny D115]|nr:hypothetical protein GGI07_002244 [Coemansia sp. Benny D115]